MLVVEYKSNGVRKVVLHKDWHPGRMGLAHIPKQRVAPPSESMLKLQAALLRKDKR